MTVKELIKLLKRLDGDQTVFVETNACRHIHNQSIAGVFEEERCGDEWIAVIELEWV